MKYYTYILQSADGSYYTGTTKNIEERIKRHQLGRGAKYLRGRGPFRLVYYEESPDLKSAMKRERQIKELARTKKEKLINSLNHL